jgi:ubiquinone/menaquinone biosynthesis C-methylase UbiE
MQSPAHDAQNHDANIQDQFTRQAEPFVRRHGTRDTDLLALMVDCSAVSANDIVLDVACGPGIVSCYFAGHARHVTGLDIVPAMIERAERLAAERNVENVTWKLAPVTELPFPPASFDCVVTRFSLHHFLQPQAALREMKRVAKPGGTVVVCDVAPRPEVQERFNHWEILRDPSHTRALTECEFQDLGARAGLELVRKEHYPLEMGFEHLMAGSFPKPGDADRLRTLFDEEVRSGTDHLGVMARRSEAGITITYPVLLLAWRNPNCDGIRTLGV